MRLRIRRLDEDEYDAPHVELSVSGGGFAAWARSKEYEFIFSTDAS
jgi:histone acetyltransferase (RNA polymerase elongator complex component)